MKDMFGVEVTLEQALVMKRGKAPSDRAGLVALRLGRGVHPHIGAPLRVPAGETCGSCGHHVVKRYAGTYHKCELSKDTNGGATDIRVRWPACNKWEAP